MICVAPSTAPSDMKPLLGFLMLALICSSAAAQAYRCKGPTGQTLIQDKPCDQRRSDSMPVPGASPQNDLPQATGGPVELGQQLCREGVPKRRGWFDSDSLKLGGVSGGEMTTIQIGASSVPARTYYVMVNGKNRFGGYVGEKMVPCYTSVDGNRILRIDDPI
mgnify:CR=1 FL=1